MKFCEAMDKLKNGSKVTRQAWKESIYFKLDDVIKAYQPSLTNFVYDEGIMISDNWQVENEEKTMTFCEIIPYLQQGFKVKNSHWKDAFIYLDNSTRKLVQHSMIEFVFMPDFATFISEDWIEL